MSKYQAVTPINNINKLTSKKHGIEIPRGEILEFDEKDKDQKKRLDHLLKVGVLKAVDEEVEKDPKDPPQDPPKPPADPEGGNDEGDQTPPDPEGEKDPEQDQPDPELPDDLDELKKIADEKGITYGNTIGAESLKKRILDHKE